jgi:hypothetical protein
MTNDAIPILSLIVAGLAVFVGPWVSWLIAKHQATAAQQLAILNDRLARCQEAHTLLDNLDKNLNNSEGLHKANHECQQWYALHSLSLSKETQGFFDKACRSVAISYTVIGTMSGRQKTPEEQQILNDSRDAVVRATEAVAAEHEKLSGTGRSWVQTLRRV